METDSGRRMARGQEIRDRLAAIRDRLDALGALDTDEATGPRRGSAVTWAAAAAHQAQDAEQTAARALVASERAFESAARAHEHAAQVHDRAAAAHSGDVTDHRRRAAFHRTAAGRDRQAAAQTARLVHAPRTGTPGRIAAPDSP